MCLIGNPNCSACIAGESGLISWRGGSLMGFLELQQSVGLQSQTLTGLSRVEPCIWVQMTMAGLPCLL